MRASDRWAMPTLLPRGTKPCQSCASPLRCAPTPGALIVLKRPVPRSARSWASSAPSIPRIRERLFDGDELRRFVNVYVNNEDIRYLEDLATPVAASDEVSIIPAVAGG